MTWMKADTLDAEVGKTYLVTWSSPGLYGVIMEDDDREAALAANMTKMATLPRDEAPWAVPGTGVHDTPPTLTVDEQIRAAALAAAAQVWQGKPPSDPDYVIRHAASYADWIRTGIENPGYRVAR